jgi:cytochrome c
MANRSTILNPITEDDQWFVTAYLIAVSPTLQETLKQRRRMEESTIKSRENMESVVKMTGNEDYEYDSVKAKTLFEQKCSQCHDFRQVVEKPPQTKAEAIRLVQRMVVNGLTASEPELNIIIQYLAETYLKNSVQLEQPNATFKSNLEGREIYQSRHCIDCHGTDGKFPVQPNYPVLSGQNRGYLIQQFKNIRDGTRNSGLSLIMRSIVLDVTDQEIELIADHLSR